jgi:uncharacterized membrane protein YedE/YeeE
MTTAVLCGTWLNVTNDFPKPEPGVAVISEDVLMTAISAAGTAMILLLISMVIFQNLSQGLKTVVYDSVHFLSGFGFGIGLVISGMAMPSKVAGFLDFQHWDPSLAFVLFGAHLLHIPVMKLIFEPNMLYTPPLDVHGRGYAIKRINTRILDVRLFIGAILFGLSWSLACVCPGPAILTLTSRSSMFSFLLSLGWIVFFAIGAYFTKVRICETAPAACADAVCAPVVCNDKECTQVGCGQ